ncbi:unnamed protein product, partial [Medioppia subpectinata]
MSTNIESNSLSKRRHIIGIESKVIGKKKTLIRLLENGGTVEEEVNDSNNCCISDEDLLRLGDIGLQIHKHYGNARDIEWGLKGGQIFMLQSRPVTNLDNSYTDYEIMHELDTAHPTEFEIYSRAHWGENYPGASSWTCIQWIWANKSSFFRREVSSGISIEEDYNPYFDIMGVEYNQIMFNLTSGMMGLFNNYPESKQAQTMVLAFFGHHIDDTDVLSHFRKKRLEAKGMSLLAKMSFPSFIIKGLLFGPKNLIKTKEEFMDIKKYSLVDKLKPYSNSKDIMDKIFTECFMIWETSMKNHGGVSFGSSIKNAILRSMLESSMKDNPNLDSDFNLLISSCNDVISAEVPKILREIAKSIKDKQWFRQLSDEEALQVLTTGSDETSIKFRQFLDRHGHRGYRESDPMHKPWKGNPMPCVKTIKTILSGNESQFEIKIEKSVEEVIDELKTPLTPFKKLLLKKFFLPWTRRGIGYRELSKYFMIWMNNQFRDAFWYLSQQMVSEGLIPTVDTFFYLTMTEVEALCNGQRDPLIFSRVRQRRRLYPKMDKYKFEEFIKGPEMKPRNFEDRIIPPVLTSGMVQMTGTPVSNGSIKARVCVSEDITEADNIQPGDILITYSTDIGWSPYFPLLSGIITEIGGTISHGAVIAREYGIPSLIAVEGACRAFRTGDICLLDTKTQTITKIDKHALSFHYNHMVEINGQINGRWFKYLKVLSTLWSQRKARKKHRIHTHNALSDRAQDAGVLPFKHEWDYDLPAQTKAEDVLIYGVNSSKQSIYIAIKWRPKGMNDKINATISLRFDDNNSNSYTLEEDSEVEYRSNEYRVCGLGLEISVLGKGSSLAVLKSLSEDLVKEKYENTFNVPNGVIVTTNAYQRLLNDNKDLVKSIEDLEKSTQLSTKDLKTKCENLMDLISSHKLPEDIKQEIKVKLSENFSDYEKRLFAVRSSGASEDSEEMSAAGQMTTYLGVKGLDEMYSSVMKCWSSQFSHIAY